MGKRRWREVDKNKNKIGEDLVMNWQESGEEKKGDRLLVSQIAL
jgi:hypothetical protein